MRKKQFTEHRKKRHSQLSGGKQHVLPNFALASERGSRVIDAK
jgi:hypothetical protein